MKLGLNERFSTIWLSFGPIFRKKILCYLEYAYDHNICAKISSLQKYIKMH